MVLYIKTTKHLWLYLTQFLLKWEMFQTNIAENIKTYMLCSIYSPPSPPQKNRDIYTIYAKIRYSQTGHSWQYNMVHCFAFWITKATDTQNMYFTLATMDTRMDLDVVFIPTLPILFFSCGWIRLWPLQPLTKWERRDEWKRKWGTIGRWLTCLKEYFQNNQFLFFCCNRM
jgi:hypothetical protein